jgi:cytochrome c-type biogenesis protein
VTDVSIAVAFAAGLLSFISPCVLALVPVYLAFLGNAAATAGGAAPATDAPRAAILPQAALFVGGFSVVFIVLGTSIGLVGAPLFRIPEVRQVAGIAVIVVGVLTTGVFGPVMDRFSIGVDASVLPTARGLRAVALGGLVAVGWTPCIGPVLGAILTMSASTADIGAGTALLAVYSLGLGLPFLAAALFTDVLLARLRSLSRAGGALAVMGVLILTGRLEAMAYWLLETFPALARVG